MKSRVVKIQSWNGFWWPGDRVADRPASQVAAMCCLLRDPGRTERPAVCPSCPVAMLASSGHHSCSRRSQQPVCRLSACEPQTCCSSPLGQRGPGVLGSHCQATAEIFLAESVASTEKDVYPSRVSWRFLWLIHLQTPQGQTLPGALLTGRRPAPLPPAYLPRAITSSQVPLCAVQGRSLSPAAALTAADPGADLKASRLQRLPDCGLHYHQKASVQRT